MRSQRHSRTAEPAAPRAKPAAQSLGCSRDFFDERIGQSCAGLGAAG